MTVLEAIQKGADFLEKKGVESPRRQCELLLAHLLKMPRMQLYLNFERALTPAETDDLRGFIQRRGRREPVQQVIGSTSFCGFVTAVNRHVLVPRPETEQLAELGWQFLRAAPRPGEAGPTALDFCTGSGCIAVALAANCPEARVVATDISTEALALAGENAARNGVADRIQFLTGDGFAALKGGGLREPVSASPADSTPGEPPRLFDLIVSNPPYIASAEIATLEPEVRDFEPLIALDGGADGLDFFRLLASQARPFLQPAGRLMVEFGDGQSGAVSKIFEAEKWIVEAVKEDYSQRARILIARLD